MSTDDRLRMPGQELTDEDLRHDAELTRQELAETVAALGAKADVKSRAKKVAHEQAEHLRERGDELVERLPEPVATKVRPLLETMLRKPMIPVGALLAFLLVLRLTRRRGGD